MTTQKISLDELKLGLNADVIGVASLEDWKGTKLEETALRLLPGAKSVLVLVMEVYPEVLDLTSPQKITGEASFNDLLDRQMEYLNGKLNESAYDMAKALDRGIRIGEIRLMEKSGGRTGRFRRAPGS